jgi:DNA segregation ATPase FtsK/SpoIIIE-like protein
MPSALSVARPAAVAVALLAAVAVTGIVLYLFWPAGVALGLAVGAIAVLAVGARMQVTERLQPTDEELEARLGITHEPAPVLEERVLEEPEAAVATAEQETAAPAPGTPALHVQPDVLYFTSDDDPDTAEPRVLVGDDPVRGDLEHLKAELGEDYRDFARAARLVVSTQYASAARLQRDLDLPYSRARRLLADLEEQRFVGPATGSLPRQVLLPKERLPEVERLLAEV